jgi:hypothetical protein
MYSNRPSEYFRLNLPRRPVNFGVGKNFIMFGSKNIPLWNFMGGSEQQNAETGANPDTLLMPNEKIPRSANR